jgi:serine/threonine protein kinase
MHYAFQSETCLHLVLDLLPGGDLCARYHPSLPPLARLVHRRLPRRLHRGLPLLNRYGRLEAEGRLPLSRVRLYAAELVLALGHVHDTLRVIFRDMKPDNILLDASGHACLADFGLATSGTAAGSSTMRDVTPPMPVRLVAPRAQAAPA